MVLFSRSSFFRFPTPLEIFSAYALVTACIEKHYIGPLKSYEHPASTQNLLVHLKQVQLMKYIIPHRPLVVG